MNTVTRTLATLATFAMLAVGSLLAVAPASQAGTYTGGCTPAFTGTTTGGVTVYFGCRVIMKPLPPMTPKTFTFRLAR